MSVKPENIRNFCIIAHIDHGKSTLADRFLEQSHTLSSKEMKEQVLDDMDLERERGITIRSHAIRMEYTYKDGETYILNLIDTPWHVDFSYEVSRSLAACEGALLLVDASQGIEAQTISNFWLALESNLTIIPIENKIDLPSAQIESTTKQIMELMDVGENDILRCSAKNGIGIEAIFDAVRERIPAPTGSELAPLKALIFNSDYDIYRGAVAYIRVVDGVVKKGDKVYMFGTGRDWEILEVGFFRMGKIPIAELRAGEVGYLICGIKNVHDIKVGDTVTHASRRADAPLPGYHEPKPMVFSGMYPENPENFNDLRDALERLSLNDSAITYEPDTSVSLGFGFRCGFLGMLHMEIVQERLDRDYGLDIINTVPSVVYRIVFRDGHAEFVNNPARFPDMASVDHIEEPIMKSQIVTPNEYIGSIMKLTQDRRGIFKRTEYLDPTRVNMIYDLPLAEIVYEFYDRLKGVTKGYASFDYEFLEYREADVVKLDTLINGEPVDALSAILHRNKAEFVGRGLASKLKHLIPRQMFQVTIQAAIGAKIIARTTVQALRKNVTAKCYGGDITRKRKLLEKQKEGKKRMKKVGQVRIPQEAFWAVLKVED
ncbi:MAG: translation elongation factor 4 [Candidatus Latescibacter sp.]|nr:translation elongation factor 4 [Candidatus Latescibacter sp.]